MFVRREAQNGSLDKQAVAQRAFIAASLIGLLITTGCASKKADSDAEVRHILQTFVSAIARGDAPTACRLAAPGAQHALVRLATRFSPASQPTCEAAVEALPRIAGTRVLKLLASATVRVNSIKGDVAQADLDSKVLGAVPAELERSDGVWKVTQIPGLASPR